jgi:hypothetical protein
MFLLKYVGYVWAVDNIPGVAEGVVYFFVSIVVLFPTVLGAALLYDKLRPKRRW